MAEDTGGIEDAYSLERMTDLPVMPALSLAFGDSHDRVLNACGTRLRLGLEAH